MTGFDRIEGELQSRYESVDWAATPLGAVETWSPTLRAAVQLTLDTRFAVTLMWGPQFTLVYNDAYARMIADKHPDALGRTAADVFPEAWDVIGPMMRGVLAGDGATWVEDLPLPLMRNGKLAESYFTFSYSPVGDGTGPAEGVIDIATETTAMVVAGRRLNLLGRLERALADTGSPDEVTSAAVVVLRDDSQDFAEVTAGADREPGPGWELLPIGSGDVALRVRLADLVTRDDATAEFLALIAATVNRGWERASSHVAEAAMSEALQRSLLPDPLAASSGLDLAFAYLPAGAHAQIGGDWYDAFRLPDGTTMLVIGDVMGHDRRAAVAMGQLRGVLRGIAATVDPSPARVLSAVDSAVRDLAIGTLATAVVVRVAAAEGAGATRQPRRLTWSNAGHLPPMIARADGSVEVLDERPGLLLGVDPTAPRRDRDVMLLDGDRLLMYTDGLVERRDRDIDDGIAELAACATRLTDGTAQQQCDQLLAAYGEVAREDDVAVLLARPAPV